MKYSDLSSKNRSSYHWINFAAASLLAVALAGCSGGGGGGGEVAAVVPPVVPPAQGVQVPPGTPLDATTLNAAQFAALTPVVPEVIVSIASPPKVSFSLTNGAGGPPIKGFGNSSQAANATVAQHRNLSFALAKLVPEQTSTLQGRTWNTPSKWVSYIVTTVPTFKSATDHTIVASVPQLPATDNTGTLVDNGNGTYTYTFFRDVTTIKAQVDAMTVTPPKDKADLGDLSYDPNAVHRMSIQISGNAPGTGNNTANGVTDPAKPAVPMTNPANVIFDFVPARVSATSNGAVTAADPSREIASTQKCNDCHQSLGGFPGATAANVDAEFHGGNRNKVEYCSVCHTDQLKYGSANATLDAHGNFTSATTFKINDLSAANLPSHIHKIHMSAGLTKTGYNINGLIYEEACKFPQDIRNCTKCHDGSATSTAQTKQGNNWMNVPNRVACAACHDGINFKTGNGVRLADKAADVAAGNPIGTTAQGHGGGPQSDDSACGFCHAPSDIDTFHIPVTPPNPLNALQTPPGPTANANTNAAFIASNTSRLPAGAIKVTYDIKSVSRNASKQPVMVFRMLQTGNRTRTDFNVFTKAGAVATNAELAAQEIWPNFMGAPSVYFVFSVPQDGIAAPADFNASVSSYLRSLWNGSSSGTGKGTLSATPDADGFYTATLTGVTIPDNAVMLTGGLGYSYSVINTLPLTQTNVAGYQTAPATVAGLTPSMPNRTGGLIVVASDQQKVASTGAAAGGTGGAYTGRRAIVEDARCDKCHQQLGPFTEDAFHAGQRNDGTTCAWCHTPNRASSGWSVDSTSFIHAIHAKAKRTVPFTYSAQSTTDGFFTIGYPGILKRCETCHLPNTFDFSAPDSASALPNRLYRTTAAGIFNGTAGTIVPTFTFNKTTGLCDINNGTATTSPFPQTPQGAFAISPYVPADSTTNFGIVFSYNAGLTTAKSCDPVGNVVSVPAGQSVAASATTLVSSPIATACFACHDTVLAKTHMEVSGNGSINEPRPGALAKFELCMTCHSPTSPFGLGIAAVHALP